MKCCRVGFSNMAAFYTSKGMIRFSYVIFIKGFTDEGKVGKLFPWR